MPQEAIPQSLLRRRLPPAALVLSTVALLLASAAPPAHAQSDIVSIAWLTVGQYQDGASYWHVGYEKNPKFTMSSQRATYYGALDPKHFTYKGTRYEITDLYETDPTGDYRLYAKFNPALSEQDAKANLGLVVGGQTYDLADADSSVGNSWVWELRPAWTDGARVIVKVVHKPAAPAGLTATPAWSDEGYPTVALAWNDPRDPMLAHYEFRMKKGAAAWGRWREIQLRDLQRSGGGYSYEVGHLRGKMSYPPGDPYPPETLDPGAAYTFEVRARNEGGAGPAVQQTATTSGDANAVEYGDLDIARSSDTLPEGGSITFTLSRPSANAPARIALLFSYPHWFGGRVTSDDFPPPKSGTAHECDPTAECFASFRVTLPAADWASPRNPQKRQVHIRFNRDGDYLADAPPGLTDGENVEFAFFPASSTEYYRTHVSRRGLGNLGFTIKNDNPGAPAGLTATAGEGEVTLAWERLPQLHRTRGTRYEYRVDPGSTDWAEIPGSSSVTNEYVVTGLTGGTAHVFEVRVTHTNGWKGPASEVRETPSGSGGGMHSRSEFGAAFHDLPAAHDGETPFAFELRFTEDVEGLSYRTLRDHAFEVANGRVRGARRLVQGSNQRWEITVRPDGRGDVAVTLPGGRACGATGAVCTADGRQLANSPSATVPGPPPVPLTADIHDLPAEHDGETPFAFELRFSEHVEGLSYRTLRDSAFEVANGRVTGARRLERGRNQRWEITVAPSAGGDIQIMLPATSDCAAAGAVCTADGRPLSSALLMLVQGPPGLSAADARVEEGAGAVLAFAVHLSRPVGWRVTVDYATADGSAQAGADYTAADGTLTFQPGETAKTVEVAVLDDAHDEGEETLALRLSNASGGRLADGEATGTIENRDPLPRALLARFGRTAAVHVVEHVEERMAAPREPGFRGEVAGRALRRGMERDVALQFLGRLGGAAGVQAPGGAHTPMAGPGVGGATRFGTPGLGGGGAPMAAGAAGLGAPGPAGGAAGPAGGLSGGGLLQMGLGGGDLLTGSAFALNRETRHGGILSFWSRGAQSSFHGREGALSLGGDVRTTMFGADYAKGPLVVGLSLARSQGIGDYAGTDAGQVASAVTGLYPWVGYKLNDRVSVWGVTGYGSGGLLLTPAGGTALESGLSMKMTAAGTRGELVAGGRDGFGLAFKADALWVGTATEGVDGPAGRLAATEAAVSRVRTALEGSRGYTFGRGLSLKPSVEVGLRHDAGDAEQGSGMDVGGGLVVSDPVTGLAVDVRVRMLLVHEAEDFRERGVSVSLSYNPTPQTPLGFTAKVAPSWGGQAQSGAEALWGRETMAGMAHGSFGSGNRLDGELGYGLPVGSRFVGTPRVGFTTSDYGRDYRVGYALDVLENEGLTFQLGVDAQRRERPLLGGADKAVLARATLGW